jgi:hypothetical protein
MKVLRSLETGFLRSLQSWKGVLIAWFVFFILVSFLMYPIRSSLGSAFGTSMITEKLAGGFDIEAFADLGSVMKSLLSFFTAGFMIVYLAGFILNAFLTGGLFDSLRKESGKFSSGEFFRAGSKNFWSFLVISFIITIIMSFLSGIILLIPLGIITSSETISEKNAFTIVICTVAFLLMIIPLFLLVADYARAGKASNSHWSGFTAIGFGFSQTFGKLKLSYIMMIFLILAQIALGILILLILPAWRPVTGGGVFLLLIISQLMFFIRLLLKTWRYASVTSLMENSSVVSKENL